MDWAVAVFAGIVVGAVLLGAIMAAIELRWRLPISTWFKGDNGN